MIREGSNPLRGLDKARRPDITRALRSGEAVRDPRNAPLAAAMAEQLLRLFERANQRKWLLVHAVGIALVAVLTRQPAFLIVELVVAALLVAQFLWQRSLKSRLERAAAANRELAALYGLDMPELPPPGQNEAPRIGSRRGLAAIGVMLVVMGGVVAVAVLTRETTEPQSQWALNSNGVCTRMADAYRRLNANTGAAAEPGTMPLRELARVRRAGVLIQQEAVTELRSSPAPGGYPQIAVAAFEGKVRLEWRAVRAAERGDRAAFDRAMQGTLAPALEAEQAFDRAGADVCSAVM